ncbi:FAD-dependent oxidoreductase [Pelagibacterium sp. H642]|uniref:FAD-dependent oxidoreductase n=1 Tax=Pelagibacterium sp. H642 TaxID=1881069 RepID=UPI002815FBFB|nr:FAD-dependent oxidoreductase [Pelagibacterium sp. H642]
MVGSGISGAMAADLLSEAGHDVLVLDRRGPSRGSTPATTALVQYEIDVPLRELAGKIGSEKATRAWRRARLAVLNLKGRIEELGIACRMSPRQTLYLAGNQLSGSSLRAEADERAAAGLSVESSGMGRS